jgi:hypothetical protein
LALKIVKSNFCKVKRQQNLNFVIDALNFAPMTTTRLEQLLRFREEDPKDPFPLYALALEYQKIDVIKCESSFDTLLTAFPDYLPTYYHAAKLKATLNKVDDIELAIHQQDKSTQRELQAAYEELIF